MSSPTSLLQQATVQPSSLQPSWWAWSPLWFCCWCWPTPCTWSSTSSTLTVTKSTRPPSTSPAPPRPSSQTRTACEERRRCWKTSKRPAWKGLLVLILDGCVVLLVFLLPGTKSSPYHCLNLTSYSQRMRLPDQSGVKTQAGAKTWTDHGFPGPGLGSLWNGDKKCEDCLLIDHHSADFSKHFSDWIQVLWLEIYKLTMWEWQRRKDCETEMTVVWYGSLLGFLFTVLHKSPTHAS